MSAILRHLLIDNPSTRRRTIFDDKPVEIQELTYIIKQDIAHLNKQIGQLQTIAKSVLLVIVSV